MRIRIQQLILDEHFFLISQLIISTLIILFTILDLQSLTSIMFSLSFANLVFLYLTAFHKGKAMNSGWILLIWCALSFLLSFLGSGRSFAFADLVSFFTFAATILFMQVAVDIDATRETVHKILKIGTVGAALYPIGYYFLGANEFRRMGSLLLTMHFSSPNLTGFYLAQGCLCALLLLFLSTKRKDKAIAICLFGFDFYFCALSGARNSLLAVLLVLAGAIYIRINKLNRIPPFLVFSVAVVPLVLAFVYLIFVDEVGASGRLDFIIEEGKPITSRVEIWGRVLQTLKGIHWIIGDYSKLRGNLHNTHLTILGSYGIVGLILMIRYLYIVMNNAKFNVHSTSQAICLICFFGTIFMGFGEAALFYGSMGLYAIACSYLIMARYDWEAEAAL